MKPASLSKSETSPAMPKRTPALLLAIALAGLRVIPAAAQDHAAVCKDESASADAAIAACSKIISVSKAKTNDLASIYYNRAIAFRQKNEIDSALADYNEAIKINPKHARAFNNRGSIFKEKGDIDRAL